jgi:hypothetical protein
MIQTVRLPDELRPLVETYSVDTLIEKHEGDAYSYHKDDNRIALLQGFKVILPIWYRRESKINILKIAPSQDGSLLTIFLTDSSYIENDGFIAIAEKIPTTDIFITTHFHNSWHVKELRENSIKATIG